MMRLNGVIGTSFIRPPIRESERQYIAYNVPRDRPRTEREQRENREKRTSRHDQQNQVDRTQVIDIYRHPSASAASTVEGRRLQLKAKFESDSSHFGFNVSTIESKRGVNCENPGSTPPNHGGEAGGVHEGRRLLARGRQRRGEEPHIPDVLPRRHYVIQPRRV